MFKLTLLIAVVLVGGCTQYGPAPDQGKGSETRAASDAATPTTSSKAFPAFTAVDYAMPDSVVYSMRCDLNSVAGIGLNPGVVATVSRAGKVVFNGWLVTDKLTVPDDFLIVLKGDSGSYAISSVAGMDRPDVAEAVGSQTAAQSGFGFEADIAGVAAGTYAVHLVVPASGAACDSTKILEIVI